MEKDILIVAIIMVVTAGLFVLNRLRSDLIAIMALLSLMLTGILTVDQALAGFSNKVVFIIVSMFIVSEALVNTGTARRIGNLVLHAGQGSEARLVVIMMCVVVSVGAFMSSTAVVAIFIPVTLMVAEKSGLNRKRLLMPLSIAALISGMTSLIATAPNLIVAEALNSRNLPTLGFFSFAPFGAAVLVLSAGFILFPGRRLLAKEKTVTVDHKTRSIGDLLESYGLIDKLHIVSIPYGCSLINLATIRVPIRQKYGVQMVAIEKEVHGNRKTFPISPEMVFAANDIIVIFGESKEVERFSRDYGLNRIEIDEQQIERIRSMGNDLGVAEIMLLPESKFIGKSLAEVEFRTRYHANVLGLKRSSKPVLKELQNEKMDFGDALLVNGTWDNLIRLGDENLQFILLGLPEEYKELAPGRDKAPLALGIITLMVVSMVVGILPTVTSAMLAALLLLLTGCLKVHTVYQRISWTSVVMIAAMIPMGTALDASGATHLLSMKLVDTLGSMGPMTMLASVFLITAIMGSFISNTATAILIAPIAIDTALTLGIAPQAFGMTVAIACSAAFATPVASPVNMLVMEPGGYSFLDFIKLGLPLLLFTMMTTVLIVGWIYL